MVCDSKIRRRPPQRFSLDNELPCFPDGHFPITGKHAQQHEYEYISRSWSAGRQSGSQTQSRRDQGRDEQFVEERAPAPLHARCAGGGVLRFEPSRMPRDRGDFRRGGRGVPSPGRGK